MRVTVCQLRDDAAGLAEDWERLAEHTVTESSDLVVLPEMPFHRWLHATRPADLEAWERAVAEHERWMGRLGELATPLVLGTRPVTIDARRRNEAFVWSHDRGYRAAHHKRYLPDEDGFWEASWYGPGDGDFVPAPAGSLVAGFLVCTELWFTGHAREYAAAGAELIVSPRATETATVDKWLAGGRVAAVMAGAFGLSSNRAGMGAGITWGGAGWIVGPDGDVLGMTDEDHLAITIEIDPAAADDAKGTYRATSGDHRSLDGCRPVIAGSMPRSPTRLLVLAVLALVVPGCHDPQMATPEADDHPCAPMAPADRLPARVGGFAFGEVHDLGGGSVLDLTEFSGCELPDGGGVVVLREGRFASVYHLDCEHLTAGDIPAPVRPGQDWLCYGPGGGFEKSAP